MQLFNCTGIFVSVEKSAQVFAIGGNDLFVPVERIFSVAVIGAVAFVVGIDVDETVALGHLRIAHAHKIDAAPRRVAHHRHTVPDGIPNGFDVLTEIVNAIGIVYSAVRFQLVMCTETVLNDEQRFLITVV